MNSRQVEYLLVGGYAVGYHGYPRATVDLDVWIGTSPDNGAKVLDVLREFGFPTDALSVDLLSTDNQVVRMGLPPIRIALITTISGVTFEECYSARTVDTIDGVSVNLINRQHLKLNKEASGRHKDLDDLEHLD